MPDDGYEELFDKDGVSLEKCGVCGQHHRIDRDDYDHEIEPEG